MCYRVRWVSINYVIPMGVGDCNLEIANVQFGPD